MKPVTVKSFLRSVHVGGIECRLCKLRQTVTNGFVTFARHAYCVERDGGSLVSDASGKTIFKTREAALKLADKKEMV